MSDQRSQLFNFGFLNNAQDATDLKPFEATVCKSLDADQLALGRLAVSDYFSEETSKKDWTSAELNGRAFRLSSGVLQYDSTGSSDWIDVNERDPSTRPDPPDITSIDSVSIGDPSGSFSAYVVVRRQSGSDYSGPENLSLIFELTSNGTGPGDRTVTNRYGTDDPTLVRYTFTDDDSWVSIDYGLEAQILEIPNGTSSLEDEVNVQVERASLPDGVYSYILVPALFQSNPTEISEEPSSDPSTFTLNNLDELGERLANLVAIVTIPPAPTGASEMRLYRRDPDADDYVLIESNTSTSSLTFEDTVKLSSIKDLTVYPGVKDEYFSDLNAAIGNTSDTFDKLFEKDGRLWLVPTDRDDVTLYSRAGDWWGWQRNNSFALSGSVQDLEFMRDTLAVGGSITTVLFTNEKIYHITGNGTEVGPYELTEAVKNVDTLADSVVNANGILMFSTVSTDNRYDTGHFGQKVYTYDLNKLTEVSAKFKNSSYVSSGEEEEFAVLRGGDKYFAKKENVDRAILYHKDARGLVEIDEDDEIAGDWIWESKTFSATNMDFNKILGARSFRLVMIGAITITFTVGNGSTSRTYERVYNNISRVDITSLLPAVLGKEWSFKLEGFNGGIVYEMYMVG